MLYDAFAFFSRHACCFRCRHDTLSSQLYFDAFTPAAADAAACCRLRCHLLIFIILRRLLITPPLRYAMPLMLPHAETLDAYAYFYIITPFILMMPRRRHLRHYLCCRHFRRAIRALRFAAIDTAFAITPFRLFDLPSLRHFLRRR